MMSQEQTPSRIKFYQNHRPEMVAGEYSIEIGGSISHAKISGPDTTSTITRRFAVYGERFTLNDQDVRSVFPAAGSTGTYASVLPHIILHRNTLPWERQASLGDGEVPWLALLLFDEDDGPDKKIITVKELFASPAGGGHFPDLSQEVAQHDDEKVTVIDVPKNVLDRILPSTDSLRLMAHTRQGINNQQEVVGEENAVIFCNRLPNQGQRSTVHLVSLEGRYDGSGFDYTSGSDLFRLVSLKSWDFYTIEHYKITSATLQALQGQAPADDIDKLSTLLDREFAGLDSSFLEDVAQAAGLDTISDSYKTILIDQAKFDKTFDGLLKHLNKDILTLRLPPTLSNTQVDTEPYLSEGLVPLEHHFRSGDRSVSWYRGPFLPFRPDSTTNDGSIIRDLHPETADELIQFDNNLGMFDVTYAAAWEIGRLLALVKKDFSVSLFQWKRLISQKQHKANQLEGLEHLPVFAHSHNHDSEQLLWEKHLQPWLTQLATLENIPTNYLVPKEQQLPKESIRFFYVDKNWQMAALLGALSVGGDGDSNSQADDDALREFLKLEDAYLTGFLLRSDVVSGWPGLLIDGFPAEEGKQPLWRQLSRDVLLCLFKTEIEQVIFYQKSEVMHFGFIKENEVFKKRVRNADGLEVGDPLPVDWQSDAQARVIDVAKLANTLGKTGKPAQFAMNMIEGVPRVIFEIIGGPATILNIEN